MKGGRAAYNFSILNAGYYLVSALVSAPNDGQNSFYVNIDAEPTDPLMIWDVPVGTRPANRTVSWRGNDPADAGSPQYSPKLFLLAAGTHQLIIRGREPNTMLGTISITAAPPRLQIHTSGHGTVTLIGTGQAGRTYNIQCSQNSKAWTVIGTVTMSPRGTITFSDSAANTRPSSMYRLQGQ